MSDRTELPTRDTTDANEAQTRRHTAWCHHIAALYHEQERRKRFVFTGFVAACVLAMLLQAFPSGRSLQLTISAVNLVILAALTRASLLYHISAHHLLIVRRPVPAEHWWGPVAQGVLALYAVFLFARLLLGAESGSITALISGVVALAAILQLTASRRVVVLVNSVTPEAPFTVN